MPSIDLRLGDGTASRTFVLEMRNAAGPCDNKNSGDSMDDNPRNSPS